MDGTEHWMTDPARSHAAGNRPHFRSFQLTIPDLLRDRHTVSDDKTLASGSFFYKRRFMPLQDRTGAK
jgi:hypothetical protein